MRYRRPIPLRKFAAMLAVLCAAAMPAAGQQQRVGVNSAVNEQATGTPPGEAARRLVIGQNVVFQERIATSQIGQTQLLFLDESAMTIGPNSDITIDRFVYDPNTGGGQMAMSATRGVLRFVGGKLSKQENAVSLRTSSATLAIRGGVFMMKLAPGGELDVVFVYGDGLTVTGTTGIAQTVRRPGYAITVAGPGAAPSAPYPAPAGFVAQLLTQLDGRPGGRGGAPILPTEQLVANSGISQVGSGNLAASIQQAQQRYPTPPVPQIDIGKLPLQMNVNTVQGQGSPVIAGSESGRIVSTLGGTTTPPIVPPPTVTVTFSGRLKNTNGGGTARGFVDQSANADVPYSGGTLTFPAGQPQQGVFTANTSLGPVSFPLAAGTNRFGPQGTQSPFGQFTGTSFLSPDNTFYYVNITSANFPTERAFIYGGTPVDVAFLQPTGANRFTAFNVQPDAALQANIPFIRSQAGGNLPNPTVSPYLVVAPAESPFAGFNGTTISGGVTATRGLQASIAINGSGAGQSSALVIGTGSFFTSADTGKPAGDNIVRGSYLTANGTPTRIGSSASTPADANGNSIYGGNAISGFVLDQNGYSLALNRQPGTASEVPLGGAGTTYGFAQPVTPTSLPANVGTSRTTQNLNGFFGGLMYSTATGAAPVYAVNGTTAIQTSAANSNLRANFAGSDPFGTNSVVLNFGSSLNGTRVNSTFIDDSRYTAIENQFTPSQVNGTNVQLNGDPTQASRIALVSSGVVPTSSLLPNGLCQSCQFLQWGYWTGELATPDASGTVAARLDRAHINTFIAGSPTPAGDINTLASQNVTGSYAGNALGSVLNNGASYLANGSFAMTYNFSAQNGSVAINNFDGRNLTSSAVVGKSNTFTGGLSWNGVTGQLNGQFFGPAAIETGGNFAIRGGPSYLASGIFAGKR